MVYCLNPQCPQPENAEESRFCTACGSLLTLRDRYRAIQPLGENARRHTLLARDTQDPKQRTCILKQITLATPEALANVVDVFQMLGNHPQIPQLLGAVATEPRIANFRPTLIQERITGTSLTQQSWDEDGIWNLLIEVLPLLHWVHSLGILHRDLNPHNLLWNTSGQLMLIDFSLAKVTQKAHQAKTVTVVGSALYTAPEQLRGKAIPASDLYSLGLVCIHLLTGMHPFDLLGTSEGLGCWVDYLHTPLEPTLIEILNRLTAEAPSDRFPTAAETYAALTGGQDIPLIAAAATMVQPPDPRSNVAQWHCVATLKSHTGPIHAVACHPRQPLWATAGADRHIYQWQAATPQPTAQYQGHRSIVSALAFDATTESLFSGSWDYTIRQWQGEQECQRYEGHMGWVTALGLFPDRPMLASGSADRAIRIWNLATHTLQTTLTGHKGAVDALAVHPSGEIIASGGADTLVCLWSMATPKARPKVLRGHGDTVHSLCFSPNGRLLFSGDSLGNIVVWQWEARRHVQTIAAHTDVVNSLAITPDGELLISASSDRTLKLWHPPTGHLIATLTEHKAEVLAVAYQAVLGQIVSVSHDKTVKLWRFGEG